MPKIRLRTGCVGLPVASCAAIWSTKVTRTLAPADGPEVVEFTSQPGGNSFWIAASETLKFRIVRTSMLVPTSLSCASAGPARSHNNDSRNARMIVLPMMTIRGYYQIAWPVTRHRHAHTRNRHRAARGDRGCPSPHGGRRDQRVHLDRDQGGDGRIAAALRARERPRHSRELCPFRRAHPP